MHTGKVEARIVVESCWRLNESIAILAYLESKFSDTHILKAQLAHDELKKIEPICHCLLPIWFYFHLCNVCLTLLDKMIVSHSYWDSCHLINITQK